MPTIFYTLPILPIHLFFVVFSFFWVIRSDFSGLLWIIGKKEKLEKEKLEKFHKYVWIGLLGLIATGMLLLLQKDYLLEDFSFKLKLFFVSLLFINSFFIGNKMKLASENSFSELSVKNKILIFIIGAISGISWIGTFILAEFL